jgi:ABC-type xylose transport system permease subunit
MERMQEEAGELQAEGLIQTSRLAAASQAIQPGQVTLEAIAAAVIGGTAAAAACGRRCSGRS